MATVAPVALTGWQFFMISELPSFRKYAAIITGDKGAGDKVVATALQRCPRPSGEPTEEDTKAMRERILATIGELGANEVTDVPRGVIGPVAALGAADYEDRQAYALTSMLSLTLEGAAAVMGETPAKVSLRVDRARRLLHSVGDIPNDAVRAGP